jgi:NADP-dependent 3-hydroxy acid dehydrogenase YdfG
VGRLAIPVNNAGVGLLGPVEHAPIDEWEQLVRVNLLWLLYSAHIALPRLLRAAKDAPRQVGDLVNLSSIGGRIATRGAEVYAATKFGVVAFSESLRQEVTKRHVRVAVVEPGSTATELGSHSRDEVRQHYLHAFSGFERLAAEDIADAIGYMVTRPGRVSVNELFVRPTEQEA